MSENNNLVINQLKKHGQKNLEIAINNLEKEDKQKLIENINRYDFNKHSDIIKMYKNRNINNKAAKIKSLNKEMITDIDALSDNQRKIFEDIGYDWISNKKIGIIILAGGDASRLKTDKPKCLYEINFLHPKTFLQEYIERIKSINDSCNMYFKDNSNEFNIPVFLIVSESKKILIEDFLFSSNYFGYPNIYLVEISNAVNVFTEDFQLAMKNDNEIWESSLGNGQLVK